MGYIQEIRQLIGRRPFILVGAGVLILDPDDRLLLLHRSDNDCWGIPGGAMEPGESLEDAARRETFEETGLRLGNLALWQVFSGAEQFYRYPNGDQVYNVSAVYLGQEYTGELRFADGEHHQAGFFPLDALPGPLSPPIKLVVEKFLSEQRSP